MEYARQYIDGAKVKAAKAQKCVADVWANPPTVQQVHFIV